MKKILIADDDPAFLSSLAEMLTLLDSSLSIATAVNGEQAEAFIKTMPIDLLITDIRMPVMDGLELVLRTAENHPDIPVIVVSACGYTPAMRDLGTKIRFFDKPLDVNELIGAIRTLLHDGKNPQGAGDDEDRSKRKKIGLDGML